MLSQLRHLPGTRGHLQRHQHDEVERGEAGGDDHEPRIDLADDAMEVPCRMIGHRGDLGMPSGFSDTRCNLLQRLTHRTE
jgi:hypothetical protein